MSYAAAADLLGQMRDDAMSITDCFDASGYINTNRLLHTFMDDDDDLLDMLDGNDEHDDDDGNPREKKLRKKRIVLARRNEDGILEAIPPRESLWWNLYVDCPQRNDSRFLKKFRRRFRVPYKEFEWFVSEAKRENWFPRWMGKDAAGKESSPIELLILGAFRYLGRGLTFDDLEESTAISEEVHRSFLHKFIEVGSTTLYERWVRAPMNQQEVEQHMYEFMLAGLPGAFASTDATHIIHELCRWNIRRAHIGFKSKHATRTFNLTANHRRRILATTRGNPGSFNDKTLILFDTFIKDIKNGTILDDYEFELLEMRGNDVVAVKYKGVWIVVDNGYRNWSTTVPPYTNSVLRKEIRWSEWLESMRKDVECTFGILKGRWRILKTGVRLHSTESVDRVWLTCCALHNWLLEIDGLDQPWDGVNATTSEWTGDLGELDPTDVPLALRRIMTPADIRSFDSSRVGRTATTAAATVVSEDEDTNSDTENDGISEEVRKVRHLSLDYFRSKLVEHFNIKFDRNEIVWPKRRGNKPN